MIARQFVFFGRWVVGAALLLSASLGHAWSGLYIFGDSLSDAGNNAIGIDANPATTGLRTPLPIPNVATGGGLVPTLPYDTSALTAGVTLDRYTNGFVWAEIYAAAIGQPRGGLASLAGGTDFAFGGATSSAAGPFGSTATPSLLQQVTGYLGATGNLADAGALYVVAGGGNNARNALNAILTGANVQTTIAAAGQQYAADTLAMVNALYGAGARNIVVWNIPDLGKTPALTTAGAQASLLGSTVAAQMNAIMQAAVWNLPGVTSFDLYALVDDAVANPGKYGFTDVTNPCAALPLGSCSAATSLFWDGIHPTSAGHQVIASAMLDRTVPEPMTLALLALAGVVLIVLRSRSGRR